MELQTKKTSMSNPELVFGKSDLSVGYIPPLTDETCHLFDGEGNYVGAVHDFDTCSENTDEDVDIAALEQLELSTRKIDNARQSK